MGTHAAAQHIQKHEASAIASGVNLMLAERTTAATQVAGIFLFHLSQLSYACVCIVTILT